MKKSIMLFNLVLLVLLSASSCARTSDGELAGEWVLVKLNGADALGGVNVTLSYSDGTVSGFGGCNSYSGSVALKGSRVEFSDLGMTLMACLDSAVSQQESDFFIALNLVNSWQTDGDRLTLSGTDVKLEFTRFDPSAMALPIGGWLLVEMDGEPPYRETQINLAFAADGSVSGFSGCASFSGVYAAKAGELAFDDLTMTAMTCTNGAIAEAEKLYFQKLQQVDHYLVEGSNLILSGPGTSLRYVLLDVSQ